tara:strand:+ start:447 stop:653 length:207 start_codon:yes stop_codon:yes gene_type:complete
VEALTIHKPIVTLYVQFISEIDLNTKISADIGMLLSIAVPYQESPVKYPAVIKKAIRALNLFIGESGI